MRYNRRNGCPGNRLLGLALELRHLRYFVVAGEEQHFSRAAERLEISQPALSEQMRELEAEIGSPLFERLPRGIRLSNAGQVFLEYARKILAEVETARERSFHAGQGEVGLLRIAFNEVAGQQQVVAESLHRFRSIHPNVELDMTQMTTFEQLDALRRNTIDIGFQHNQGQDVDRVSFFKLRSEGFVLAIPACHELAKASSVCLADLHQRPLVWLHRSVNPLLYDQLRNLLSAARVTPNVVVEPKSDISIMNLVSVGMGLGVVVSAKRWGQSDSVVMKPIDDLALSLNFGVAWRRSDNSPLVSNFVAVVKEFGIS